MKNNSALKCVFVTVKTPRLVTNTQDGSKPLINDSSDEEPTEEGRYTCTTFENVLL